MMPTWNNTSPTIVWMIVAIIFAVIMINQVTHCEPYEFDGDGDLIMIDADDQPTGSGLDLNSAVSGEDLTLKL